jgi:hypothetical protein
MSNNNYAINPVNRAVNNFFDDFLNSTHATYIQPIQTTPTYTPPPVQSIGPMVAPVCDLPPRQPYTIFPSATTTYTPESLRDHFVPLNSNYNDAYYGRDSPFSTFR